MTDRMIPVPESLIERFVSLAERADEAWANRVACDFRDLLSQPEPSAAPECTCGWGGVHDPDNPRCDRYAAPPSITDMVPGTTFWARTRDGVLSSTHRMWFVDAAGYVFSIGAHHIDAQRIDPSTIRDVTPPPTTPEGGR